MGGKSAKTSGKLKKTKNLDEQGGEKFLNPGSKRLREDRGHKKEMNSAVAARQGGSKRPNDTEKDYS